MRFTIRDVLWLTLVVAILVAWLIDHQQLRQEVARANDKAFEYLMALTKIQPMPTPLPAGPVH